MADPPAVVPYNDDPYDAQYFEQLLYYLENNNSTLEDLSIEETNPQPPSIPQQGTEIEMSKDLFHNGGTGNVQNGPTTGDFQAGRSEIRGESSNNGIGNGANFNAGSSSHDDDSIPSPEWSPTPFPFGCSCCQVLREIVHTNGNETATLEIHGRLGMFFHAILDVQVNVDSPSANYHYQIIDFSKKSTEDVRQFMVRYCLERKQAGFFVISDPLSTFYEVLCGGLVWAEDRQPYEFILPSSSNSGEVQGEQARKDNGKERAHKINLAEQRQRTGKMKLKDIGNYFHLPIEEAAKKMRICPTVVKKICRRDGLARWPHRKIKSMERQISNLASVLTSNDPQVRVQAQNQILRLQQEIENIRQGVARS